MLKVSPMKAVTPVKTRDCPVRLGVIVTPPLLTYTEFKLVRRIAVGKVIVKVSVEMMLELITKLSVPTPKAFTVKILFVNVPFVRLPA